MRWQSIKINVPISKDINRQVKLGEITNMAPPIIYDSKSIGDVQSRLLTGEFKEHDYVLAYSDRLNKFFLLDGTDIRNVYDVASMPDDVCVAIGRKHTYPKSVDGKIKDSKAKVDTCISGLEWKSVSEPPEDIIDDYKHVKDVPTRLSGLSGSPKPVALLSPFMATQKTSMKRIIEHINKALVDITPLLEHIGLPFPSAWTVNEPNTPHAPEAMQAMEAISFVSGRMPLATITKFVKHIHSHLPKEYWPAVSSYPNDKYSGQIILELDKWIVS
jgi:hypothetical protein